MFQFIWKFLWYKLDDFSLLHISEFRLSCTKLSKKTNLIDIEIGQSSALYLIFYLQVPAFDVLVFVY